MKFKISLFSLFLCSYTMAQIPQLPNNSTLQQLENRQAIIDEQLLPKNKRVIHQLPQLKTSPNNSQKLCFPIKLLKLNEFNNTKKTLSITYLVIKSVKLENLFIQKIGHNTFKLIDKNKNAPCLTATQINNIAVNLQNNIIANGWITSRILITNQSLKSGVLNFSIVKGYFNNIKSSHKANMFTAFPIKTGDILNLRDLEQGLDNLKRLPTVNAKMNIIPSQKQNMSDIEVQWRQRKIPLRLNLSLDDSGSKLTGKYLGTVSVSWDNPLHINDIFSVSYTHNISSGKKEIDPKGNIDKGKTYNYSLNYSVPFGYWLASGKLSYYFYDQIVAGANRNYHYKGSNKNINLDISRVIYRDSKHKITLKGEVWFKDAKNYIDDAEIKVQHKKNAGYKAQLSTRSYFSKGTLTTSLGYKGEVKSWDNVNKSKILTMNIDWDMPFNIHKKKFNWYSKLNAQLMLNKLTSYDFFSIGSRYNVRGFDASQTLSAEHGWYLRNDISWLYSDNHQLYLGLDIGKVFGKSVQHRPSTVLSGTTLGLKGKFKKLGNWSYDFFFSTPLQRPNNFKNKSIIIGFNLDYNL